MGNADAGQIGGSDPGQSGASQAPGQSGSSAFDPGQSGSNAFDPGQSGSADPGQTGSSQFLYYERVGREERTGVIVKNGRPYLVTESDIQPIDATLVPSGRMLTKDGKLVPGPANVTTLAAGPAGQAGIVRQGDAAYMIHGATSTPLNATTVPEGQILTFDGKLLKAPKRAAQVP
jgi:hypothetical protein